MAAQCNRQRPIGTDGMTMAERDVMARWDAGASIQRIAGESDHALASVERIVSMYAFADEDRVHRAAASAANIRFLAAVTATGGKFA